MVSVPFCIPCQQTVRRDCHNAKRFTNLYVRCVQGCDCTLETKKSTAPRQQNDTLSGVCQSRSQLTSVQHQHLCSVRQDKAIATPHTQTHAQLCVVHYDMTKSEQKLTV